MTDEKFNISQLGLGDHSEDYYTHIGIFNRLVKDPKHFDKFRKSTKTAKIKKLSTVYMANLLLKYQQTQMKDKIKEEKGKAKVKNYRESKGKKTNFRKTELLNNIMKMDLENDRFREKIAALEHTLDLKGITEQGMGGFMRKKDDPEYISGITGKRDRQLDQDIKLMKLMEANVEDSKKELARLNIFIRKNEKRIRQKTKAALPKKSKKQIELIQKYETLTFKFDNLKNAFLSLKGTNEKLTRMMQQMTSKLSAEDEKYIELEAKVDVEAASDFDPLKLEADVKRKKKAVLELEKQLKIICEKSFFTGPEDRIDIAQELRGTKKDIIEAQALFEAEKMLGIDFEKQKKVDEERLSKLKNEVDELKDKLTEQQTLLEGNDKKLAVLEGRHESSASKLKESTSGGDIALSSTRPRNNRNRQEEEYRKVFFGDELRDKTDYELQKLGVESIEEQEGPGWYNLKLIPRSETRNKETMVEDIQKLILENGELASQLEKCNSLMTIHKEMEADRVKAHLLEVKILDTKIKKARSKLEQMQMIIDQKMEDGYGEEFNMENVEYDDTDSVFSVSDLGDRISADDTSNIFDLAITSAEFERTQIKDAFKQSGADMNYEYDSLKVIFLVDFFNFDTQTSQVFSGFLFNCQFQATYNLKMDKNFMRYCLSNGFRIEVIGVSNQQRCKLGECRVNLAELLKRNARNLGIKRNLVAIIRTVKEVSNGLIGFPVGNLHINYRFRRPCGVISKLFLEEIAEFKPLEEDKITRRLVIKIKEATGLPASAKTFISYSLFGEGEGTFFTKTVRGREPKFDYLRSHELAFTPDIKHMFETETIEFVAFDDNVPVEGDDEAEITDILGSCEISLKRLLDGEMIDDTFLMKDAISSTTDFYVRISIYFYDFKGDGYYDELYQVQKTKDFEMKKERTQMEEDELEPYKQGEVSFILKMLVRTVKHRNKKIEDFVNQDLDTNGSKFLTETEFKNGLKVFDSSIDPNMRQKLWNHLTGDGTLQILTNKQLINELNVYYDSA